ncbi:MAG: DNA polymerase III subunit delta [Chloroflexi bacterium]|nr:DNA polymerase III subunit delta [Chloroflexota bacterium]MCY3581762.1 DNA polymerase III subunit delta [Chloroflexota bacterium]MCY3714886.1 DNA polymerase III subunit delta [Chloroflexota bacterium]MDE2649186.1 DNA polymerase III subunit delta [Chloroflexota bacterium]MXV93244.1 DNA polymerase III subunit delta [Chloroflexota bacterium]
MSAPTCYIFHGEDIIKRDEELHKMRAAMGEDGDLNRSEFDGAVATVPEIVSAVKVLPFLAEKRLVIARGLLSHITRRGAGNAGKKAADRLIAEMPNLPAYARLVLVEDASLRASNRVLKAANKLPSGYVRHFTKPKDLTNWIIARARDDYAQAITPAAASAIASIVNQDLLRAENELHKLVCYVDGERPIDERDVAALCPYVPEADIFKLVDALAQGHGEQALRLVHQSLHDDPRDPGFRLFAMFVRQFRLLLMTRDHIDSGGGAGRDAVAKALGAHPFVAGKLAVQARRYDIRQLETILKRLQRYDQDMKTGRIEPRLALDMLVTSLARQ